MEPKLVIAHVLILENISYVPNVEQQVKCPELLSAAAADYERSSDCDQWLFSLYAPPRTRTLLPILLELDNSGQESYRCVGTLKG